jgi:hypothetical protein
VYSGNGSSGQYGWSSTIGTSACKRWDYYTAGEYTQWFQNQATTTYPRIGGHVWGTTDGQVYAVMDAYLRSNTSGNLRGYFSIRTQNASTTPTVTPETVRIGESSHSTGDAMEVFGTVRVGAIKFGNNNIQQYPVITPATADNDKVLVANGGVFNWADIGIRKDISTQQTTLNAPTTINCADPSIKQKTQNTLTASMGIAKIAHLAANLNGQEIELMGIETECTNANFSFETGKLKLQSRQTGQLKTLAEMGVQNSLNANQFSSLTTTADIEIGKLTGSNSDAGLIFSDSSKQQKAVTNPGATSGLLLTSDGNNGWSWVAPSAPTPTYPKVDARSQSGSNLTLQNTNGTTSTISADGILWGWRGYTQIIENTLYCHRDVEWLDPNGISWHNGVRYNESIGVPYMLWAGGSIIYSWLNGYQYRFNAIYFIRWYNTRFNWDFGVYGSNDKQAWTQLGTFNMNSTANFTDGKSSSTQTLGGTSITFPARTSNDAGIYMSLGYGSQSGNKLGNHIERFTFANNDYYRFYMLKHIGPSNGLTLGASMNMPDGVINSMNEIEWG